MDSDLGLSDRFVSFFYQFNLLVSLSSHRSLRGDSASRERRLSVCVLSRSMT